MAASAGGRGSGLYRRRRARPPNQTQRLPVSCAMGRSPDIYTDWNIDQLADTLRELLDAEAER